MRALTLLVFCPLLAACESEPVAPVEQRQPDPVVRQAEVQRSEHLRGNPGAGDFKVNFGEPFIGFENRGSRMAIRQNYGGPSYRVIDVARSNDGVTSVFRASEGAIPGSDPFVLTIERGPCTNEFTGEQTGHIAWLGTVVSPRQVRSCAAPAK